MANRSDRDDLHAPPLFATFTGGTARALESTDAPANAQHLPCAILVVVATGGGSLVMKDANGVSNTIALAEGVYGPWRMAPATLESDTDSTVNVTVFWQPMARCG